MAGTKFVSWNCCGLREGSLRTDEKLAFFDKEFQNSNFDVACFVETHHRDANDIPEMISQFKSHYHLVHTPTPTGESHAGIIALVSKSFELSNTDILVARRFREYLSTLLKIKMNDWAAAVKVTNSDYRSGESL